MHETDNDRYITKREDLGPSQSLEIVGVPCVVVIKSLHPLRGLRMLGIGMADPQNVVQLRVRHSIVRRLTFDDYPGRSTRRDASEALGCYTSGLRHLTS